MSLREKLIEKVLDIATENNATKRIAASAPIEWTSTMADDLARECIRQMEWAGRNVTCFRLHNGHWLNRHGVDFGHGPMGTNLNNPPGEQDLYDNWVRDATRPISAAPEGWKP